MTGIKRYMRILALFDEARPTWTVSEMSEALETSPSTLYRLIRELVGTGMLESTVESKYRLGQLFVEYFRRVRMTDPLIRAGTMLLEPLAAQAGVPCRAILARLYGDTVMCVAEYRSANATFRSSYELGRPMPLFRGATSKAVLSTLTKRATNNLFNHQAGASDGLRDTLIAEFAAIRKGGICEAHGEVDPTLVGIAAPLCNSDLGVHASLSLIIEEVSLTEQSRPHLYSAVVLTAGLIQRFMAETAA